MIGYCKKYKKEILTEAECFFCDCKDVNFCIYFENINNISLLNKIKNFIIKCIKN